MNRDEKKEQRPKCTMIAVIVVVLLLLLGYLVMRDSKGASKISGGKWKARGGCACVAPPK